MMPRRRGNPAPSSTRQDLADVFALHVAGRTRVIAEQRQLGDVNTYVDDLLAGRVSARVVFGF
jgi:propanol-preferring alcohol dehydrogenase